MMSEFQGVAISEAPLLFRTLLFTGAAVVALALLIFSVVKGIAKRDKSESKTRRWLWLISRVTIPVVALVATGVLGVYATRHWLDYGKKDYCVYAGSYEVREEVIRRRGTDRVSFVAVLPDGHRIDISMGDVGYTTGTLVYTARTNILLGYDDSVVIKPEE